MITTSTAVNEPMQASQVPHPDFVKRIGKAAYRVSVHFSETSKETMADKIMRMLRNEISQSTKS